MILTSLYHIVRLHTIIDEAFGGSAGTQQEKPKAG